MDGKFVGRLGIVVVKFVLFMRVVVGNGRRVVRRELGEGRMGSVG